MTAEALVRALASTDFREAEEALAHWLLTPDWNALLASPEFTASAAASVFEVMDTLAMMGRRQVPANVLDALKMRARSVEPERHFIAARLLQRIDEQRWLARDADCKQELPASHFSAGRPVGL